MANLKSLRIRMASVQSTRKITAAMKMIAAAKLRKAQTKISAARPYATYMNQMIQDLDYRYIGDDRSTMNLLVGRVSQHIKTVMIIVGTSNRGLCGGFNTSVVRQVRTLCKKLQTENKTVKILCIGSKGYDQLVRHSTIPIIDKYKDLSDFSYASIKNISAEIIKLYSDKTFDQCLIVYNKFISPLCQEVTFQQLIPAKVEQGKKNSDDPKDFYLKRVYTFEPSETEFLEVLLPYNLTTQLFTAFLENDASEHGARMAAMESATRNAEDMIRKLSLAYNRTRQAVVTNELIEIIAGAEAL